MIQHLCPTAIIVLVSDEMGKILENLSTFKVNIQCALVTKMKQNDTPVFVVHLIKGKVVNFYKTKDNGSIYYINTVVYRSITLQSSNAMWFISLTSITYLIKCHDTVTHGEFTILFVCL